MLYTLSYYFCFLVKEKDGSTSTKKVLDTGVNFEELFENGLGKLIDYYTKLIQ